MVDIMAATEAAKAPSRMNVATRNAGVDLSVTPVTAEALAAYEAFARGACHAPAQGAAWVRAWVEPVQPDAIIATISESGRLVFALALEIVRRGPFRVARLLGGSHANGNFAPGDKEWLGSVPSDALGRLTAAIGSARPDIDVLLLERLVPEIKGFANPLLGLPTVASPNVSLAVDLHGGFDALLARSSGKRKRKKHRSQTRKFESAGGHRRIEASTPEEVETILTAFFAMKTVRFEQAGIANVFEDAKVQAFFRKLFLDALSLTPRPFVLHALDVGGKLRAITGSSRFGDRLICEFGAIVEDELAYASPGDFLFFENIKQACDAGLAVYDFSVGDELYKRLWCDIETRQQDVIAPLSAKGRLLALSLRGAARLKASIKGNVRLWRLVKRLRRQGGAKPAPTETSED